MAVATKPPIADPNFARLRLYAMRKRREQAAGGPRPSPFDSYRFEPERYIVEKLGWTPWRGSPDRPGQADVLDAYTLALRQQHVCRNEHTLRRSPKAAGM